MMAGNYKGQTHYAEYLKLDDLLKLQQPLSDHPDEYHFIIIHQIHELWFKLALHHLGRVRQALIEDQPIEGVRLLSQVTEIFENLQGTVKHLQSLPPMAFHTFRMLLAPGSGMQSFQFREIELVAGRRDPQYLKWVENTLTNDYHWEQVKAHLGKSSLMDEFTALLARRDAADLTAVYAHPDQYPDLYALADALSVLDQTVVLWRYSHIQLVERTIGAGTTGTGGTTHDYLQKASQVKLFPQIWEARNELSRRVDEATQSPG